MGGDQERDLGIPISPGMDRNTAQLPASQIGFIKFVVKRLYQLLAELVDSAEVVVDNMLANEKHWIAEKERLSKEEKEKEKKENETEISVCASCSKFKNYYRISRLSNRG